MDRIVRVAGLLLLGGITLANRADAGPLDPTKYDSLGTLSIDSGTYTIDSRPGVLSLVVGGTTYKGVVDDGVAVFDFDSIHIGSGASLLGAQGYDGLPIALLSRTNATIDGLIDVSSFSFGAGPGAGGGGSGGDRTTYWFPGSMFPTGSGAGGGGFGGRGEAGSDFASLPGGVGGATGTRIDYVLRGGGYGGGGSTPGGGAIEIGAVGSLSIGGEIDAIGGDAFSGGGGSGGGIFLHGSTVGINGLLSVQGGTGDPGNYSGRAPYGSSGGGGGGQIVIQTLTGHAYVSPDAQIILSGGGNAEAGLFLVEQLGKPVPEPSSLTLLGTATLGLFGGMMARRRSVLRRSVA